MRVQIQLSNMCVLVSARVRICVLSLRALASSFLFIATSVSDANDCGSFGRVTIQACAKQYKYCVSGMCVVYATVVNQTQPIQF